MKERIKELWRRDIQKKLCEDLDYFIIINSDGEVGAIQYSLLGSILVFSQYKFALDVSEKFGTGATVEKVTRDELFDRFSDKFDFFELDSEIYVDKVALYSQNSNVPSMDVIVELFDRKILGKLDECNKVILNVNNALDDLKSRSAALEDSLRESVKMSLMESDEKHKKYFQRKTRNEVKKIRNKVGETLSEMIKKEVIGYFAQVNKRIGNLKL